MVFAVRSFTIFISILQLARPRNFKRDQNETIESIFKDEQIIFSSDRIITRILVPVDGKFVHSNDIPSIFFTVADPKLDGGSCIYVLEGLAAYEVLEGGRDSTADYGPDSVVYFGAKDGIYKYDPETLSAKRYGIFRNDIQQIQKLNGTEAFYALTSDQLLYKIENGGRNMTRVYLIECALEFVLDTSNNIYYVPCNDGNLPRIVLDNKKMQPVSVQFIYEFKEIKLLRPAFVMEECILFFGDGSLYMLHSNGTSVKKDFAMKERPSAFSVDASLYLVAAFNGKIYEFNVMEVLLKSMFGLIAEWPRDISRMILSMMETTKGTKYTHYL